MGSEDRVRVVRGGEEERLRVGNDVFGIKASGRDTSGQLLVMEVTLEPGGGLPVLHRHASSEVFVLLDGEFEVRILDGSGKAESLRLTAGDSVSVPSMVWHNLRNTGSTPGKILAIHGPATLEDYVREVGRPVEDGSVPGTPASDRGSTVEIMRRYMEVLPLEQGATE